MVVSLYAFSQFYVVISITFSGYVSIWHTQVTFTSSAEAETPILWPLDSKN